MNTGKIALLFVTVSLVFSVASCEKKRARSFCITDFGAVGDGQTVNTNAVTNAVKACADAGGGTVTVPAGTYLTGSFELFSNVNLHLEAGARLKGSTNLSDYRLADRTYGLIRAKDADNIAITGPGIIDGSGTTFMDTETMRNYPQWKAPDLDPNYTRQGPDYMQAKFGTQDGPYVYHARPGRIIRLLNCTNILLRDITIVDAPSWTVHFDACTDVTVTGIRIKNSLLVPNSDGIHCTSCKNVHICDCEISAGDDCIALTCIGDRRHQDILGGEPSTGTSSENITVTNCTLQSRSAAVRVGYTGGDIKNCTFSNLVIRESNRGLLVNVRERGSVEKLLFQNITIETRLHTGHWWGQAEPIHVSAIKADPNTPQLGVIKNVRFENIIAESESGIVVFGSDQSRIQNLSFENVSLKIKNSPLNDSYGGNIDLRTAYDMSLALFRHDIPALYATHVDGLQIQDFAVEWEDDLPDFFNHAIHCENFNDLLIDGFRGRQPHIGDSRAAVALNNGSNVTIRNCTAADDAGTFLSHSGISDPRLFAQNDLSVAQKAIEPEASGFRDFANYWPK